MSKLNVSLLAVPESIKQKLLELSANIDFDKSSDKGANGYTFFGKNLVHSRRVAIKFSIGETTLSIMLSLVI